MARNTLKVPGFPEWLPEDQKIENEIRKIIAETYEQYGFLNIETPAVEKNTVLMAKSWWSVSQQIFWLNGLAQTQKGIEDFKDYSLHFDLTVPMARYVVDHESELAFPFKRFQIQKVHRGEAHQAGRFKEFYQCDVDVVDTNLDVRYDAETIEVLYKTMEKIFLHLGIDKKFIVQINNRKIYDALFDMLQLEDTKRTEILGLLDDYYKLKPGVFDTKLNDLVGEDHANTIKELLSQKIDDPYVWDNEALATSIEELKTVYSRLQSNGVNVNYNPYIVRGLDYYNGTVFETFIEWNEEFGSVCSGGRFDNLVKHIRDANGVKGKEYGGVGWSIGLSRLLHRLQEAKLITQKPSLADVMIFNIQGESESYRREIAGLLRSEGLRVDEYMQASKLDKQFGYATKKNIPLWVFVGQSEEENQTVKVKNLGERRENIIPVGEMIEFVRKELVWVMK
jgi:histidyl-tRNA synthetase